MSKKKYKILILLFIFYNNILAQENYFLHQENKMSILANKILTADTDSIKIEANHKLQSILSTTLKKNKSYLHDFINTEHMYVIQPKDKKFKLFTWFIPYNNGEYEYYGIIQKCKKNGKKCEIYHLKKTISLNEQNINMQLNHTEWYGCVYYDLIPIKVEGKKYYTLLGWDGNNNNTTKKIIDVVQIPKKEEPIFGANIFSNNKNRIIIEYSSKYSISLKYDEKLDYIVYDHLEPLDGVSTHNFNLYAPNLSYDVLKRTKLGWRLESNIYLNNKK